MGLKIFQILAQKSNKIQRMQKYASPPGGMSLSSLSPSALNALDSLGIHVGKKGRSVQEQLQHLSKNWSKKNSFGHFDGKLGQSQENFKNVEIFTKSGSSHSYLKVNGELYYLPPQSYEKRAFEFTDNLYNKFLGQTRSSKSGGIGYNFSAEDNFTAYKFIEADASITDYPNLLKDGFGLDCLLSTPISAKSVIVKNGQTIRLENGLTKYISHIGGQYGNKHIYPKELITQEVNISRYFEPDSEAYEIVKNFSEKDIIESLKKLNKINEKDLAIAHNKFGNSIDGDYIRIEEQLKLRREYLLKYAEKMEQHPKKGAELMSEYLERIEGYLPKHKEITAPVDKFLIYSEPDSVLKSVEENWQAYKRVSKQIFENKSNHILIDGTFTHNAKLENIESVLDNGLLTGQATLCKMGQGSSVAGNWTSTPAQLDTFIVKGEQSIKDYFTKSNRHSYEWGFMSGEESICYTIDKNRVNEFHNTFLPREPEIKGLYTHYTFPFGVPASCIDRMIVSTSLEQSEINNIIKQIKKRGLDIKLYNRDGKLLYEVQKTAKSSEDIFKSFNFAQYGKSGIPLKYTRSKFRNDVWTLLDREVPVAQRTAFLTRFNLKAGANGVLDGVPIIKGFVPKTQAEKKMLALIEEFYKNESVAISPQNKNAIDALLKEYPEFSMMIGKPQHGRHAYSVDIHSLNVLQKAMNEPVYETLSEESKEVLRLTALMHDFGKMGSVVTPGHAKLSREMAERVLTAHNVDPKIKARVLNQIENHHWFEGYNRGIISAEDIAKIFTTKEDREIAIMLANADFQSVNPNFHLQRMTGSMLTQEQFNTQFKAKMKDLAFEMFVYDRFKK